MEPRCLLAAASLAAEFASANLVDVQASSPATGLTVVSGWLQSAQQTPMIGVPVELAGVTSITDDQGYFRLEFDLAHLPTSSFNIAIPAGDPWFDPFHTGAQTIPMQRAIYSGTDADSGTLEHPNLITSFIDASMIYGSDDERAAALRSGVGGRLKVSEGNLLPLNNAETFPEGTLANDNSGPIPGNQLFAAGDVRANENVGLLTLQTLLMREHNRLADSIRAENPRLSDEEIYQQARRLLIAMVEHITYSEYLPVLLGEGTLPEYTGYDPSVDPAISAIFSGAAFRVGHTQLPATFQRLDANYASLDGGELALRNAFFNPNPVIEEGLEPYLRGMYATLSQEIDPYVIDDVRNFLFGPPGAGGMDLAAINIQRGRDLGLPSYNQARIDFGLAPIENFAEISSDPTIVAALASVYDSVDQIDVWVGGLAEDHAPGAQVGELFQRIIADQFARARDGDRYWYENGQFTQEELDLIRGTSLVSIIERNTTAVGIAGNAFTTGTAPTGPAPAGFAANESSTDYRSITGYGNNLQDLTAGAAYDNLLTNFTPGDSAETSDLPGAREVSNAVIAQSGSINNGAGTTALFVFWGQLLDHDLGLTPGGKSDEVIIHGDQWTDPAGYQVYQLTSTQLGEMLGHELIVGAENEVSQPLTMQSVPNGEQSIFAHFHGEIESQGEAVDFEVSVRSEDFHFATEQAVIGWKVTAEDGSVLDPAAVQVFDASGNAVPTRIVQDDEADDQSSMVLVDMPVGDYRIVVQAEDSTMGAFHLEASLAGDTDGDRRVTSRDLLKMLDQITSGTASSDPSLDFDHDGQVTAADLTVAIGNFRNSTTLNPIYLSAEMEADAGNDVTIHGETVPGMHVDMDVNSDGRIDDQLIAGPTEEGANFVYQMAVFTGVPIVTVSAGDRFGQTAETTVSLTNSTLLTLVEAEPSVSLTEHEGLLLDAASNSDRFDRETSVPAYEADWCEAVDWALGEEGLLDDIAA